MWKIRPTCIICWWKAKVRCRLTEDFIFTVCLVDSTHLIIKPCPIFYNWSHILTCHPTAFLFKPYTHSDTLNPDICKSDINLYLWTIQIIPYQNIHCNVKDEFIIGYDYLIWSHIFPLSHGFHKRSPWSSYCMMM